ncbi:MAG: UvrD-helicase domain-containing protein [Methanomicrobiales archaeon]|nr:UvrD-helicase domain-containing protein [Methanomicrobiales archaeon]
MTLTERQRQALDHTRSLCVTAGAGTGKTKVLVEKYIDLLESGAVPVDAILALTFTEKAAKEMKERIRSAIAGKSGERWERIREEFPWANISTFHSFCSQVLREFPLEAGVDPGFSVLEDRESQRIREEAIEDLFHTRPRGEYRDALLDCLRAVGAYGLKAHLLTLYEHRETAVPFFAELRADEGAIVERWDRAFRNRREAAVTAFFADGEAVQAVETLRDLAARYPGERDSGMRYLRAVEDCLSVVSPDRPAGIAARALVRMADTRSGTMAMGSARNWQGDDLGRLRDAFGYLRGVLGRLRPALALSFEADAPFSRATLRYLRNLGIVFSVYREAVDAAKARIGAIDFSDMIYRTHTLFRENDGLVASHFRNRFRYILVDEFQDTDPPQCRILWRILGDLPAAKIFVVGDPKQSIYLFRNADVTQFKRTKRAIVEGLNGREIGLDVNFRSAPEVLGFVNYLFSALLADADKPWEFGYDPLRGTERRQGDRGSVAILLSPPDGDAVARAMAEAEMVARKIQHTIERERLPVYWDAAGGHLGTPRPAEYRDVAILLERRSNLGYFEWALRKYGIPYHIHAGIGFYRRQEIFDLYNLLRFLDSPSDDVALYGVLRSPYVSLSDAALYRIARSGGGGTLHDRLRRSAAADPDLAPAAARLESWLEHAHREPTALLIERILRDSAVFAVYGGVPGGQQAIANVEKLVGMARSARSAVAASLGEFVEDLRRRIVAEQREGEAPLDPESGNAVSVMTVHASKGLEFPIVVVPDMAAAMPSDNAALLVDEEFGIGVAVPNPENGFEMEPSPVLRVMRDEHNQKLLAERRRLFYVATTRAKDHLIVCGIRPKESPACLEDCRNRIDWLYCCLGLTDEAIRRGSIPFVPPNGAPPVTVSIVSDPDAIPAEIRRPQPQRIDLPPGALPAPPALPGHLAPVAIPEAPHTCSASEIEHYLRCPREYHRRYRLGVRETDPTLSVFAETARTRGLLVHEIFQGRDPEAAARRYGIRDPEKVAALADLCRRFLASPLMTNAAEDRREVPFVCRFAGAVFGGKIDRLVRLADGSWALIDYKTGHVEDADISGQIQKYELQMAVYTAAAEQILRQPVKPYLYFTGLNRFVEIPVDFERAVRTAEFALENISKGLFGFPACERCRAMGIDPCPGLAALHGMR